MTRTRLSIKNANPSIYGYGSLEELLADDSRFYMNDIEDKKLIREYLTESNPLLKEAIKAKLASRFPKDHWILYVDADGDKRFIPVTREFFYKYRNTLRNEVRKRDLESRCTIPSNYELEDGHFVATKGMKKAGLLKKCMYDCNNCPLLNNESENYKRTGRPLSLNLEYNNQSGDTFELLDMIADTNTFTPYEYTLYEYYKNEIETMLMKESMLDQEVFALIVHGFSDAEIAIKLGITRMTSYRKRRYFVEKINDILKN